MTRLNSATSDNPFIIAEIGSNWVNIEDCRNAIALAKNCGADAVKFQLFDAEALYGARITVSLGSIAAEWLPRLKEKADACGIEFMCTAFSPELLKMVDPFVEVHKIASSDLTYPQLLKAAAATKKEVILSCGASSVGDIRIALAFLKDVAGLTLLYCNSAYPSREHNLFRIPALRKLAPLARIGLSDHSLDVIYAPRSACRHFGATVIEKHVNFFGINSPDAGHSLDATQFKSMCDYLRGKRDAEELLPTGEEHAMFLRHNRRLIAIKPIAPGDVLRFGDNYGAYRSLQDDSVGMSPFLWNYDSALEPFGISGFTGVEGRRATKALKIGDGLAMVHLT